MVRVNLGSWGFRILAKSFTCKPLTLLQNWPQAGSPLRLRWHAHMALSVYLHFCTRSYPYHLMTTVPSKQEPVATVFHHWKWWDNVQYLQIEDFVECSQNSAREREGIWHNPWVFSWHSFATEVPDLQCLRWLSWKTLSSSQSSPSHTQNPCYNLWRTMPSWAIGGWMDPF